MGEIGEGKRGGKVRDEVAGFGQVDFLVAFLRLLKGVTVYPKHHPLISGGLDTVLRVITERGDKGENLILSVSRGYLFINAERVEVTAENYAFIRLLLQAFNDLGLGEVEFLPAVITKEDLYGFFKLLTLPGAGFTGLLSRMDEEGIKGVFIRPYLQVPGGSVKDRARKLYFQTLTLIKKYFRGEGPVPMVKMKAVATYLADILRHSEETMIGLTIIKNYDDYTYNHCLNVAILSLGLALRLGMDKSLLISLGTGALVHDIGKVKIPSEILNKPGVLTEEEWDMVKLHPVHGLALLLRKWGITGETVKMFPAVLEHHLGMNLTGYPEFLRQKVPGLLSRIIHITDFYDAVTTPRVYNREPFSPVEAMEFLMDHGGERFDPVLVKVFVQMMGMYPVGTVVKLSTGEWAMVVERSSDTGYLDRPVVAVVADHRGVPLRPRRLDLSQESVEVVGLSERSPWEAGVDPTRVVLSLGQEP